MKLGLVLSGGGGKGAYELGVWKALVEMKLDKHIEVISGTSIGAFNAALFAQGDMENAQALWDEVTMEKLVPMSKMDLLKKGVALALGVKSINFVKKHMSDKLEVGDFPKDGAYDVVNKFIDVRKVKESGKICYAACTELPECKVKYFKINDYDDEVGKEIIMASASLPLIYDSSEVDGKKYLDGGMVDNTPIQPVYGEGCDLIIVVHLSKEGTVDRSLYPNAQIIEIVPKSLDDGMINGTLNLDGGAKRLRAQQGYDDTMNLLGPIMTLAKNSYESEMNERNPFLYRIYSGFRDFKEKLSSKDVVNK
ncbi:patatin-like phospholipase family protein [Clostridium sp. B9]|uniref:patatin-like phospholipase family protein n=1 Tax=Clostridium sp. B9 TaxID=3423224 RepID=UPI003D2F2DC5